MIWVPTTPPKLLHSPREDKDRHKRKDLGFLLNVFTELSEFNDKKMLC